MQRVRFRDPAGSVRTGEWTDEGVAFAGTTYAFAEVDVLPPCEPTKLVCIGRNYAKHAAEFDSDVPDRPMLFLKGPNAVAGHGDRVTLPSGKERLDHEAELAVVVGEQCRNVDAADAMDVVAGYTAANDLSNRDDQREEQNWVRGKAFDNASPLGPTLASPDEVPDDASIELRVNGETRQSSSIDHLAFGVAELIAEITEYLTLEPGDVILTGTPEGVSPLSDGDVIEIDVEGIPTLRHWVEIP
jgi:2-keto-4-pentenoate hydratase/2-oxohepta-3-ene-1,7-dioic acid hydratase in catechol pathway